MVVNVICDERTMRELYLPAFEVAIRGKTKEIQPRLVMAAYNQVMGEYCCESKRLLQGILRNEWKFEGVIVSDWAAVSDRVSALNASMDLEMPGSKGAYNHQVVAAVQEGLLEPSAIDDCATRVFQLINDYHNQGNGTEKYDDPEIWSLFDKHHQLAREIAQECIVLLQNRDNLLPLSKSETRKIALIGEFAKDHPRFQGMGSAHTTPTRVTSIHSAMSVLLGGDNASFSLHFAPGYDINTDDDSIRQSLIDEAVDLVKQEDVDVVFVCVGLPEIAESEGFDRPHLRMPQQHIALVESVCKVHSEVVVILSNGGIVEIPESIVKGAKVILDGFLSGQAGGAAMVDILFGTVSPSGRLAETIPMSLAHVPSDPYFPGTRNMVEYRESLDVGYRGFDSRNLPVRFPFGYGLSYGKFIYENLQVSVRQDGVDVKRVALSVDVQNVGPITACEVVQVYVHPEGSTLYRPVHELKDFGKVKLAPNETRKVTFELDERAFAVFDVGLRDWVVEATSQFQIEVGSSSRDIHLRKTIRFQFGKETSSAARESYPPVNDCNALRSQKVDDTVFAKRFGSQYQSVLDALSEERSRDTCSTVRREKINRNTLLKEAAASSWIAFFLMYLTIRVATSNVKKDHKHERQLRMIRANVENLPLRNLVLFSQGKISFTFLDALICVMNFPGTKRRRETAGGIE
jgi:beta-glucosidase